MSEISLTKLRQGVGRTGSFLRLKGKIHSLPLPGSGRGWDSLAWGHKIRSLPSSSQSLLSDSDFSCIPF